MSKNALIFAICLGLATTFLLADPVIVGTFVLDTSDRSAQAIFQQDGNHLIITLSNTHPDDLTSPSTTWLLTGLFFDTNAGSLTPLSAFLGAGSSIVYPEACDIGPCDGVTDVGGEFAYESGISGPGGSRHVIGSAGFGSFLGAGSLYFGGPNLDDPFNIDGSNFGILPAGDDPNTVQGSLGSEPLIRNQVVLTLILPDDTPVEISNVHFQYGTDLNTFSAPEPSTLLLSIVGLLGVGAALRKRSNLK